MSPEDKYHFPEPSERELSELGALVDELEDSIGAGEPHEEKIAALNERLTRPTTPDEITSYYGGCSLEEFVRGCLVPLPGSFPAPTDEEMLWLVSRAVDSVSDLSRFVFYAEIVEHALPPSSTSVSDLVFHEDITEPTDILSELRARKKRVFQL